MHGANCRRRPREGAARADPKTDPQLRFELGTALYNSGDHSAAIPHLQQATRNPHIRTKVLLLLGRTFRAKGMFDKVAIPCLGVVENMSYFICDGCSKRHEIFFHGGAKAAAERMRVPFLGEIPIEPGVVDGGDHGDPVVHKHPTSQSAKAFVALAEEVATSLAKTAFDNPGALAGPSISISGGSLRDQGKNKKKGGLPVVS